MIRKAPGKRLRIVDSFHITRAAHDEKRNRRSPWRKPTDSCRDRNLIEVMLAPWKHRRRNRLAVGECSCIANLPKAFDEEAPIGRRPAPGGVSNGGRDHRSVLECETMNEVRSAREPCDQDLREKWVRRSEPVDHLDEDIALAKGGKPRGHVVLE